MAHTYDQFIASKLKLAKPHGFEPELALNPALFDWQKRVVAWAIRQGRCALFEDCGLGKTLQQLEWARHIQHKTSGTVLILAPLAVADQTVREGEKFGIAVTHVYAQSEIGRPGIYITNYERLEKFDAESFVGIVLDESSILKAFMGKTRMALTAAFANTPYRLCCTATPAPNDYMEFGQHCEFLGVMDSNEMLSRWFINDTMNFGTYRLKGHARQDFWKWVAGWAACISTPSDIGFSDDGYILPPLNMTVETVAVDQSDESGEELFRNATLNATSLHKELRRTCPHRCQKAADIANGQSDSVVVWCNTNYEADELVKLIPDAVEVRGNDSDKAKEEKLRAFTEGGARVIITKPSIAGQGLNWQHCNRHVFVGLSYSFEDFYQALRRGYRFGQARPFFAHIIQADTEGNILKTVQRKMEQHEEMRREMKIAAESMKNESDKTLTMKTDLHTERGDKWTLIHGDCVRAVSAMESDSINFSVYSPPFANLYIYSSDAQDMGNTEDNDEFLRQYGFLIEQKLRVTKPGCLTAVHCKNLVEYKGRDGRSGLHDFRGDIIRAHEERGWQYHSEHVIWKDPVIEMQRTKAQGLLFKQLCQDSRFSRSGMPEYVLLFRKWAPGMEGGAVTHDDWKYIGTEGPQGCTDERQRQIQTWQRYASPVWMDINQTRVLNAEIAREDQDQKHICPLQLDVIDRLLWLYTNKGDLVLSPFSGIGSEGYCAVKMGRRFIGSELKKAYFDRAIINLKNAEEEGRTLFEL